MKLVHRGTLVVYWKELRSWTVCAFIRLRTCIYQASLLGSPLVTLLQKRIPAARAFETNCLAIKLLQLFYQIGIIIIG